MSQVPPGISGITPQPENTKPYSTNQYPKGATFSFEGDALQAYVKDRKPVALSKPGYEIYFYSRMDTQTAVDPSRKQSFHNVPPTLSLYSDKADRINHVPVVTDIKIITSVTEEGGYGTINLTEPKGSGLLDEFFKPTIGDKPVAPPDYDFSANRPTHRIGTMDTVLIKLTNQTSDLDIGQQRETVFRGVVGEIVRKTDVQGSTLQIRIFDFAEFLRRCMAVRNGIFSTISFSLTGRGLIYNGLNYANHMLNGDLSLFGIGVNGKDVTKTAGQSIPKILNGANFALPLGNLGSVQETPPEQDISFLQHQMLVPPFFYLEFSDKLKDDNSAIGASNAPLPQQLVDAAKGGFKNGVDAFVSAITNPAALTQRGAIGVNHPEDAETVQTYAVASTAQQNDLSKDQVFATTLSDVQKYAWIASDLYLEKGLITFEHQYIWDLIQQTAGRSMREAYFDVRPKLQSNASQSYQSATVVQQKDSRGALDDLHPNIGILKYRLSPCFTPYREHNQGSYFWMYKFTDDDVISYQTSEKERDVYTAVLGYGYGTGRGTETNALYQLALGESRDFAFASSIDRNLERRIGYRFMSDHDAKFQVPVLREFVSYVLLLKSQMGMFSAEVTLPGRPDIVPGSIVRLDSKGTDYYCTQVTHNWSLGRGYTTVIGLRYGHTKGRLPAALIDMQGDTEMQDLVCTQQHKVIRPFVQKSPTVGDVSVECLVTALWNYWVGGTSDSTTIRNHTKENQGSNFIDSNDRADWITLSVPNMPTQYDSVIASSIKNHGLDQYNVTVNLVKNLIQQESSWNAIASHTDYNPNGTLYGTSYGWFQIEFPGNTDRSDITIQEAQTNFQKACDVAMSILLGAYRSVGVIGCTGEQFLLGLERYNTGPAGADIWSHNSYVSDVLGGSQANAIASGTQYPGSNQDQHVVASKGGWPYYTYGPCGIRVAQADESQTQTNPKSPDAKYNSTKKQLLDFQSGMALSVNYITSILNDLKNRNVKYYVDGRAVGVFDNPNVVNQSSLLEKAIAAWYSNELQMPYDPNFDVTLFLSAKKSIMGLYGNCTQCNQVANPDLFGGFGTTDKRMAVARDKHIFYSNRDSQENDILSPFTAYLHGTTDGLIALLSSLIIQNQYFMITALNADHPSEDGPNGHNGGKAMDCVVCDSSGNVLPPSDPRVQTFLAVAASFNGLRQIGLGGAYKNYQINISAAGATYFADNDQEHVHIGVA